MSTGTDLSLRGIADLVGEFLEGPDLHDLTLVGNDTGGALVQLVICNDAARVGRIVLASCEAFDNFPPSGIAGRTLMAVDKLPPAAFGLFMQQVRLLRRLPIVFGWLTRRGDPVTAGWMKPTGFAVPPSSFGQVKTA